jgi:hypothetical protein
MAWGPHWWLARASHGLNYLSCNSVQEGSHIPAGIWWSLALLVCAVVWLYAGSTASTKPCCKIPVRVSGCVIRAVATWCLLHAHHSSAYTPQFSVHTTVQRALHSSAYTPQFSVHTTVQGTHHSSTYTPQFRVHTTVQHAHHSSAYTPQFSVHSTVRHTHHSSGYIPQFSVHARKVMFRCNRVLPVRRADNLTTICEPIV